MKKFIVVLLILTLCFSAMILAGCNKKEEKVETCKVTFLDWDGSVIQVTEVVLGEITQAPKNLRKPDDDDATFTFLGWDDLTTEEIETFSEIPEVTKNVSYQAVYESSKVFFIHFMIDGEEYVKFKSGDNYVVPTPEREGFVFEGWYADETLNTKADPQCSNYRHIKKDEYFHAKFTPVEE